MADRLHRDYWTAERAVEAVDRFAISERARLTLPTIRRALMEAKDDRRGGLAAVDRRVTLPCGSEADGQRESGRKSIVIIVAGRSPAKRPRRAVARKMAAPSRSVAVYR